MSNTRAYMIQTKDLTLLCALMFFGAVAASWFDDRTTSRNVTTAYVGINAIGTPTYRWEGEIFRRCPVELRRWSVDSDGVIFEGGILSSIAPTRLGERSDVRQINVPQGLDRNKEFTYHVNECARCTIWQKLLEPSCEQYPPVTVPPLQGR